MDGGALDKHYEEYLARVLRATGNASFEAGSFVKNEGRLVRTLRAEEFDAMFKEYHHIARTYFDAIERGDTINDMVVRLLRERASELFLDSPV